MPVDTAPIIMDFREMPRNSTYEGGTRLSRLAQRSPETKLRARAFRAARNRGANMTYHPDEKLVIAHTAESASEAMVIRGLLESAGIHSLGADSSDPFPLNDPPPKVPRTQKFLCA